MRFLLLSLLFTLSFASLAEDEILTNLKLKNSIRSIGQISSPSQGQNCGESIEIDCPPVHVTKWCEEQYKILQADSLEKRPDRLDADKTLLFLAEEHGDENAYNYYENLIGEKKIDCLFLELPDIFQANFDAKKGIIHDGSTFENQSKNRDETKIHQIKLIKYGYLPLLKSLVEKAKESDVKVILVDSSNKSLLSRELKDSLGPRNATMAKNIQDAFDKKECSHGLSIQGSQHLFSQNENVKPIDQIMKEKLNQDILIKKAMIYSSNSESFEEAMGPCSWLNILPKEGVKYYSKDLFKDHSLFPEEIHKSMKDVTNVRPSEDADFVVMLPNNLSRDYFLKRVNGENTPPKKFKEKKVFKMIAREIPLSLKTNTSSLGIYSGNNSLANQCYEYCDSFKKLRAKYLISDIKVLEPTIKCQSYHPSRTGGASRVPKYHANYELSLDCFCVK